MIYHARFGGIEKVVFDILKHQPDHSEISQGLLILKPEGELLHHFENLPVKIHRGAFKSGLDFSISKISSVKRTLKAYDIVHFHVFHLPAILCALTIDISTVYTEHGNFGFGRKVRVTDRVNHFFKGIFLRRKVDFITYNSNFTRSFAQKKYRISHGREGVVYNGIDFKALTESREADFSTDPLFFNIGTISRLAGFKRIDRLISAFAKFAASRPDAKLYIGGEGVLKNELEAQACELNMEEKIVFTGYLENAPDFMGQMDVCVFPSHNEPFGIVAVESLSRERPTLVFADGGGLVEIIERNNPKDIVENEEAMVCRLVEYYTNREQQPVSPLAKQEIIRDFSIATMCTSLNQIYTSL